MPLDKREPSPIIQKNLVQNALNRKKHLRGRNIVNVHNIRKIDR